MMNRHLTSYTSPLSDAAFPPRRSAMCALILGLASFPLPSSDTHQDPKPEKQQLPGIWDEERKIKPNLTTDEYFAILAERLTTPDLLQRFFESRMTYVKDIGEYWQLPWETVLRTKDGRMQGDCDDFAFFAYEILRLQGHNPHVVHLPSHAECMWVTRRPDGRFDGHSMGTFHYDCNGNSIRGRQRFDKERAKGYATVAEALQSLCLKYRDHPVSEENARAKRPQLRDAVIDPNNVAVITFLNVLPPVQVRKYITIPIDRFTPTAPPSYSPSFSKPIESAKQDPIKVEREQ